MPILLFLLRKTGSELTSMPIFLHFIWDAATAWLAKGWVGVRPGSKTAYPGPLQQPGVRQFGSRRAAMHHLANYAVVASHIKWRKMGMDVSPGPVFLSKKKQEDWQMLAQG